MTIRRLFAGIMEKVWFLISETAARWVIERLLTVDTIRSAIDGVLDIAEKIANATETEVDDRALKAIREALDIPDNDDETESTPED